MKKKNVIIFTFLLLISFFSFNIFKISQHKQTIKEQIKVLPEFSFSSVKENHKNISSNIFFKSKTVIIHFNSTCHFCQEEVQLLKDHEELLKSLDINIVLISEEDTNILQEFLKENELYNSDFQLLKSNIGDFYKLFGTSQVPTAFLYNANGKLIKTITGLSKFELITQTFLEDEKVNSLH
ncbi:peroxiredoxin family protein [Flammeovirga pacifica]|uniref:Redoxin domain-containing protein n=1 Tax=Flammeovirga pacifica TaxID=915059 RepID=A0A1S1Z1J4_FLAPC|nr:TlpA disulfide reductase family protein [Flammeovirga pacifica]OHX67111.1 hypothetical protein NH26_12545 [Flammeovirga pacifica]